MAYSFATQIKNIGMTTALQGGVVAIDATTFICFYSEDNDDLMGFFITYDPSTNTLTEYSKKIIYDNLEFSNGELHAKKINDNKILLHARSGTNDSYWMLIEYNTSNQSLLTKTYITHTDFHDGGGLKIINENTALVSWDDHISILNIDVINDTLSLGTIYDISGARYSTDIGMFNNNEGYILYNYINADAYGRYFSVDWINETITLSSTANPIETNAIPYSYPTVLEYEEDKVILAFVGRLKRYYLQVIENNSGTLTFGTLTNFMTVYDDGVQWATHTKLNTDNKIVVTYPIAANYIYSLKIIDYDSINDTYSTYQTIDDMGNIYGVPFDIPNGTNIIGIFNFGSFANAYKQTFKIFYVEPPSTGINQIFIGSNQPTIYVGNTAVTTIYIGNTKIYET